jgi:hypothetical protein
MVAVEETGMSRPSLRPSFSEYPAELRAHLEEMGRQHDGRAALIKRAALIEHQAALHSPESGIAALVVAMVNLPNPEPKATELADIPRERLALAAPVPVAPAVQSQGWWPFRRRA